MKITKEQLEEAHNNALDLCYFIESLPASEVNTTLSVRASILAQKIQNLLMSERPDEDGK